jgi:hypothetical protein
MHLHGIVKIDAAAFSAVQCSDILIPHIVGRP